MEYIEKDDDKTKSKRKQLSIYMKNMLVKQVHLPLSSIGNNLTYILETIISRQIGGKCIQEGFIKPGSIKILTYSSGNIDSNYVIFKVIFECLVCNPVEGMHINCIVKNITKAGIKAETLDENSPLIIFIARDHHYKMHYFSSLKINDKIKVRVIGQRFELEDSYISIIAELIEPYSERIKRPKIVLEEDEEDEEPVNIDDEKKYLSTKREKTYKSQKYKSESKKQESKESKEEKRFDDIVLNYDISDVKHKIDYKLFSISESSKYSSLMPWHLKQVEEFYEDLFIDGSIKRIIDATANIGVDSIFFSKLFPNANIKSFEIMEDEFKNLKQNIINFGVQDRVEAINENILNYIDNGKQWWFEDYKVGNFIKLDPEKMESPDNKSFIYIDAPWGGPDYYKKKKLQLFLEADVFDDDGNFKYKYPVEILEFTDYLFKAYKTSYVVLKVPKNFYLGEFYIHFNIKKRVDVMRGGNISFILLVIEYINDEKTIEELTELLAEGKYEEVARRTYSNQVAKPEWLLWK